MMAPMDGASPTRSTPLDRALAWIEPRLDEPLTLEAIAAEAGLSPYHFSRLFTARMGRSVMAHVRGRRLIRAARRLRTEPRLKLVDLALDSGFESQAAFTRAFRRIFGVTPGRFRRGCSLAPLEGQYPMTAPDRLDADVERLPGLARIEAFTVAGFARRFGASDKAEIPQLWTRLMRGLPFAGMDESWATYGLMWDHDHPEGTFSYMAGVGLKPGAKPPAGFETKAVPAADYLVFRITLNGGAMHPQVKSAMAKIWGELIPASGLKIAETPDFERYDGKFAPTRPGAVIDFHAPVVS